MLSKDALGYLSLAVGVLSQLMYFWSMRRGHSKPHAFSWGIWGLLTAIAFFAQASRGAGAGAWATGLTAVACFSVAGIALYQGQKDITRSDWLTFIAALMALPLWYVTENPLSAVVLIICIDALGYYPTFRKSYFRPHEEMLSTYALSSVKFIFAVMAMGEYSLVTLLYPVFIITANTAFVAMAMWRRGVISG